MQFDIKSDSSFKEIWENAHNSLHLDFYLNVIANLESKEGNMNVLVGFYRKGLAI